MSEPLDLNAIEARLNAVQAETTQAQAARALRDFLNNAPTDIETLIAEVRRLADANAHLERLAAAWKLTAEQTEDEARAALATARLDGARAMLREVEARAEGVAERHEGLAKAARAKDDRNRAAAKQAAAEAVFGAIREIRTLDPAAVVGASPSVAPLSSDDGEALMRLGWSVGQILAMPADEARATLAAGERPVVVGSGS